MIMKVDRSTDRPAKAIVAVLVGTSLSRMGLGLGRELVWRGLRWRVSDEKWCAVLSLACRHRRHEGEEAEAEVEAGA